MRYTLLTFYFSLAAHTMLTTKVARAENLKCEELLVQVEVIATAGLSQKERINDGMNNLIRHLEQSINVTLSDARNLLSAESAEETELTIKALQDAGVVEVLERDLSIPKFANGILSLWDSRSPLVRKDVSLTKIAREALRYTRSPFALDLLTNLSATIENSPNGQIELHTISGHLNKSPQESLNLLQALLQAGVIEIVSFKNEPELSKLARLTPWARAKFNLRH